MEGYLKEEWLPITLDGCSERYSVSNYGRVYDHKRERFISPVKTGKPEYYYVNLKPEGSKKILRRVHNIMMRAFYPEGCEARLVVDHIDRNRFNNSIDNLRWVTRKQNMNNKDSNIIFKGLPLKKWCELNYPDTHTAQSYIYYTYRLGTYTEDEIIHRYERHLAHAHIGNKTVSVNGTEMYLVEFLEDQGLELEEYRRLIREGLTPEGLMKGYRFSLESNEHLLSLEIPTRGEVSIWFPNKLTFGNQLGLSRESINTREEAGCVTLEDYIEWTKITKYTVDGFTGTLAELSDKYGITLEVLRDRVSNKKWDIEKAVKTKRMKTKIYFLNGERMTKKAVIEKLLPDEKCATVSTRQSHKKVTMEENLEHYGVDLSTITLEPCI